MVASCTSAWYRCFGASAVGIITTPACGVGVSIARVSDHAHELVDVLLGAVSGLKDRIVALVMYRNPVRSLVALVAWLTSVSNGARAVACAVAALGFLCVVAGDRLAGGFFVAGARSSTTARLSRTSRLNAPALSSEFVDRLNARPDRSWTARVPKGMESATHADLARLAGGRLSAAPKDTSVWRASAFASTT